MKIVEVEATPVNVGYIEPERWSQGERAGCTAIVVQVTTDDGLTGLGESVPAPNPEVTVAAINSCRELLIGQDPRNIRGIWRLLRTRGGWRAFERLSNAALAGVELACWDILGISLGVPVWQLLGGRVRDMVEIMGFVQNTTPEQIERDARAMVVAGYRTIYTKVGFGLDNDVQATEALRAGAGPEAQIRVDPNEAWTSGDALRMAWRLKHLDLQYIEQPTVSTSLAELRELRRRSPVPIAANQASWLNWQTHEILARNAADVIMTDPWQAGGISSFLGAAAMCESAGIPLVYHSFAPLAIASRAAVQVLATSPACMYAHQTYAHMLATDVVESPVIIENGSIAVDDRPGLGVTIHPDRFGSCADAYLRDGYISAFGAAQHGPVPSAPTVR